MKDQCQKIMRFDYGTRLKEDSSRDLIDADENLKVICKKISADEVKDRFIEDEFELLQKMTTTKKNQLRLVQGKFFKKYYGVNSKQGPYRVNAGEIY